MNLQISQGLQNSYQSNVSLHHMCSSTFSCFLGLGCVFCFVLFWGSFLCPFFFRPCLSLKDPNGSVLFNNSCGL